MKKFMFIAAAAFGIAALAGCKKDETKTEPVTEPEFTEKEVLKTIPFTGGTVTYEFETNRAWSVTEGGATQASAEEYEVEISPIEGNAGKNTIELIFPMNKTQQEIKYSFTITLDKSATTKMTDASVAYKKKVEITVAAPSVTDAAGNTYKAGYFGGNYWMTENLRYVPDGKEISKDPSDKSGIWYPYVLKDVEIYTETNNKGQEVEKSKATAAVAEDEATINEQGLLYSANIYLGGIEYGEGNFEKVEGVQGICPEGWHIPTKADFIALCGYAQGAANAGIAEVKDEQAPFYDEKYKGGKYDNAVSCGWNPVLCGTVTNAYSANVITRLNSENEDLFGKQSLTYWAGSTGYSKTQVWAMMTTFTATSYPAGRLHCSFANATNGVAVRCVMDQQAN